MRQMLPARVLKHLKQILTGYWNILMNNVFQRRLIYCIQMIFSLSCEEPAVLLQKFDDFVKKLPGFESPPFRHKRNLFCLPRQKGFFLAFLVKKRANIGKIGLSGGRSAVRKPFFSLQDAKTVKNAVLPAADLSRNASTTHQSTVR